MHNIFNLQDVLIFLCAFLCASLIYMDFRKRKFNLPPGPIGFPFVGYLPFLQKDHHIVLTNLCKKYGNIMSFYVGRTYAVVVADYQIIKDIFNQTASADKSVEQFYFIPDGLGIADTNGVAWQEQRRYTMRNLKNLGLGKSAWENDVHIEISEFLNYLEKSSGKPISYYKQLLAAIGNNVMRLAVGHRIPVDDPKRNILERAVDEFIKHFSKTSFISILPKYAEFLKKIGFNVVDDEMLAAVKDFNRLVREEIEKHKQPHEESSEENYIDGYLKEIKNNEEQKLNNSFNENLLTGNVQVLIFAGSQTMELSVSWLFLAMATYPEVQKKIHQEIDSVLDGDERPNWTEHTKLPYTFAAIMEGQRWRSITPIVPTHTTNAELRVGEYVIPKNVEIMALTWTIHHDPKNWPDPERFMPERFLTEDNKIISNPDNYLPFSVGKRACPGQNVAHIEIFCFFASVMQKFEILPAVEGQTPDLRPRVGLLTRPAPQDLRFISRT